MDQSLEKFGSRIGSRERAAAPASAPAPAAQPRRTKSPAPGAESEEG
jgi:hypothetical protein